MADHIRRRRRPVRSWLFAVCGLALLSVLWIIAHHIVISLRYADSDFFTFWLGGRFVVSGLDPYDATIWTAAHNQYGAIWIPNPAYVYPLPLAVLMSPLGAIDLFSAYQIWIILSGVMILAASWLVFGRPTQRADLAFALPWLAGVLLFRPVIVTLRNGQLGGFLLFVLALGCSLAADKKDWGAGAVMGFLSLKPALDLPLLGLIVLWMLSRRRWRFVGGTLGSMTALFLLGWIYDPQWVGRLAGSGSPKLFFYVGNFPTAWGLGTALCGSRGTCSWLLGGGLAAAGTISFAAAAYLRRKSLQVWEAASLAVPVALFASPYVGVYDLLLLLLPIGASLTRLRDRGTPYLFVTTLPIWIDLVSLILVLVAAHVGLDLWSSVLDLLVLGLVWAAIGPPFGTKERPGLSSAS
jgi:multidrug transporter EmrE-like cation transporter